MSERTVTTQAGLDDALNAKVSTVYIDSPAGVWLHIGKDGQAWGSSHVVAWGSSHVEAWDSSHVEAWDSSHVEAWDSSHVEAWGSSHVVAWDSSHVVAWGSSHVEAWDSSHVEAGTHVAVHLHSQRVDLTGGVLIDMTAINEKDPAVWAGLHGAKIADDGTTVLYKALDDAWQAGHSHTLTSYAPGTTAAVVDWRDDHGCGGGLHLSPSPSCARQYMPDATRFVAVKVVLADVRPIPGGTPKVKVRTCDVLYEVDLWGDVVQASVPS